MRRLLRCGISLLAVALTAAGAHPISGAQAESIRFGAILTLTGPGAATGTQAMRGIRLAVENANAAGGVRGSTIEILFEDDHARPDQSIRGFNKLTGQQKVPVIFTGSSRSALAMAPLAARKKILLVNAGGQADRLATASPYLVSTVPTLADEIEVLSQYLVGMDKKRGAILFVDSAAGIAARNDLAKYFPEAGGTILAQEPTRPGQTDFRPSLLKLAYARPDVVLMAVPVEPRMAQQYRRLGLTFTVAGTSLFADPDTVADAWPTGCVHTQVRSDAQVELTSAFRTDFGAAMGYSARQYDNAARIVLAVTDKVLADGKPLSGEAMRDTLFDIRSFQGLIPLAFNSNTATVPLEIDVTKDGKDVTVKQVGSE